MADISFPAHITVRRELDADGLPIVTADVDVDGDVAGMKLPAGAPGPQGRKGQPRTTFRKMGAIENAAARPAGLGPDDRGKWWHRLDDNGMDCWDGAAWVHSPQVVGPQGPVAPPNTITAAPTKHEENLTVPAVRLSGSGPSQQMITTAPAGLQGPKGPAGASGTIADALHKATGPTRGSVFAFNRANQMFRPLPPPLGIGPWSWSQEDFAADQEVDTALLTVGTFTVPAQPFAWRPIVQGHVNAGGVPRESKVSHVATTVCLNSTDGAVLAGTRTSAGLYLLLPLLPWYRDGQVAQTLSPASGFAKVPAGQPASLVVSLARTENNGGAIGFRREQTSLVVYAQPI
ncbi:hypothetical protein NDR87_27705 [Nocardia sp. CDC159]|uniref:Minor tail protein n=1 Tax=Nocardia pulmonis TaxID=2951408 RepID=A0A9X2IZ99_9NOCA|nr:MULTISPECIES: hypothetical protein [Nocardia]MCM6777278.1 hypothetical protein [Nocardia pulmonis]MCM6790163.1 hypothetical protein [Nocardia sp. CDC159]